LAQPEVLVMASKPGRTNKRWNTPERRLCKALLLTLHEVPGRLLINDRKPWVLSQYRALVPYARELWPPDVDWGDDSEWGRAFTGWASSKPKEHPLTGTDGTQQYMYVALEIACGVHRTPVPAVRFIELAQNSARVPARLKIKTREEFRALLDKHHPAILRYKNLAQRSDWLQDSA
jgi:hypothetical protein